MNHEPLLAAVKSLAECLVSYPTDLRFEIAESVRQVVITINGNRDDIGKLMGRDCRNVKAIQAIAQLITETEAKTAHVNIAEGWTGLKGAVRPAVGELPDNAAIRRLGVVCRSLFKQYSLKKVGTSTHTTLTVFTTPTPRPEIQPALQTIFKAFGGMNNRFVTVEVVEGEENASVAA